MTNLYIWRRGKIIPLKIDCHYFPVKENNETEQKRNLLSDFKVMINKNKITLISHLFYDSKTAQKLSILKKADWKDCIFYCDSEFTTREEIGEAIGLHEKKTVRRVRNLGESF